MKHTMLLKLFNWEIIPILKEIKPSIVMFLQPVAFQAVKGKQRSERSAKNRWLKMLFNNIWLFLSEMSLLSPQEKQLKTHHLFLPQNVTPIVTCASTQRKRPKWFWREAGRRSAAEAAPAWGGIGIAADVRSQLWSRRSLHQQNVPDPQAL